jgi:hypothetical protein
VYFATKQDSAGKIPAKEKTYENQILDIYARYGRDGACFDHDSKRFGTMRVAHEDSETRKLE